MAVDPKYSGRWVVICRDDEPNDELGTKVELEGGPTVTAFRVAGRYYVIDDLCTHGSASLSEGYVDGVVIECPFHGGKFSMETGEAVAFPCTAPLKVYETMIEGGNLLAYIPADLRAG
ncbi:MAG: non-heme iron oxygenase ferredoxin subunit [Sphingomonas sp.]|uniref:non-heme iron oxygenase ferredoxin subunit n=1 Tax=Sphingomonas sp. TaxID=28214 RepID=UPI00262AEDC2|nr:non-heme iron oxygenase ferredoxin subunit [Sphingomonas sp.]MDK2766087.1 non-heme iron oxygenase ferredoxin subunit [Sphingomonas sp.]